MAARAWQFGCAVAALMCGIVPVSAHAAEIDDYRALRTQDTSLQSVGWRLLRANALFCDAVRYSIGITVDDAAAHADPTAMRRASGLTGDFIVQTVAEGSPAALSGIVPGMEIHSIGGLQLSDIAPDPDRPWWRMVVIADLLEPATPDGMAVTVMTEGPRRRIALSPVPICASRLELGANVQDAAADGARIVLDRDFIGFTYPEDQFAAILAHELAHNVLRHRAFLDANGRKRRDVRTTEREADRLMPWLLANAGYDPAAALRFMARWGPEHARRSNRVHDQWRDRYALIEDELPQVAASLSRRGKADWSRDFQRQSN
ncbi:MAG: M48 family metalloprotease [Pontixanthobacter sp.]